MATPTIQINGPIPGPKSQALMEERRRQVARGPFHATPIFIERAHGAVIEDVDGNRLIDLASGIGVVNSGHTPEALVAAVREQAGRVLHAGFNVTPYESYIQLARALNDAAPGRFAKKTFLVNSGAEAVENAIKIARVHTRRQAVVCFEHGFHGRTYMAMTLTSKVKPYRLDFGPFPSEVYRVPFPYAYRWPGGGDSAHVSEACFARFQETVVNQIGASNTAAVIIEPVLGEGGFVPAPREFLAKLRAFCNEHGIVLIADEIQTGFGRTGSLFACEQLGLEPDLMALAKGLGGGLPIGAVTGRAEIMDAPIEGGIGGTYGGNPVACASALAVMAEFKKGDLLGRARALGEKLASRFAQWQEKYACVGEARGLGPMRAIELVKDRKTREPNRDAAGALQKYAWQHGVVVMTAGTYGNVLRVLAPLVISEAELEEALGVLEAGLAES